MIPIRAFLRLLGSSAVQQHVGSIAWRIRGLSEEGYKYPKCGLISRYRYSCLNDNPIAYSY